MREANVREAVMREAVMEKPEIRQADDRPAGGSDRRARNARGVATVSLLAGALALAGAFVLAAPLPAQDANVRHAPGEIEELLAAGDFEIGRRHGARYEGDRTDQVLLQFESGEQLLAKWARAPRGGEEFNNNPRYEVAAYQVQKLFLDPGQYVVPPTVCRCFSPARYAELAGERAEPTFDGTSCVLTVLQYWLWSVTASDVWDEERLRTDDAYARSMANLDVFTYLVNHKDANVGNFLLSTVQESPRAFAVDNGVTFRSKKSDRGDQWSELRVDRVPRETVARLRELSREDLQRRLGVLVQFQDRRFETVRTEPGRNLDPGEGVRVSEDGVIQLGLTRREIRDVHDRIQRLLRRVDSGDLEVF